MGRGVVACVLIFALAALAGCGKRDPGGTGPQVTFDTHCARCHAQAGQPGGPGIGGSKGPNLSKVGAEPGRSAEWLADFIRDPKSKRADAKLMPGFKGTIPDAEIVELANWLAAKK
jgi:mono/diheme cytochrome c family protein